MQTMPQRSGLFPEAWSTTLCYYHRWHGSICLSQHRTCTPTLLASHECLCQMQMTYSNAKDVRSECAGFLVEFLATLPSKGTPCCEHTSEPPASWGPLAYSETCRLFASAACSPQVHILAMHPCPDARTRQATHPNRQQCGATRGTEQIRKETHVS